MTNKLPVNIWEDVSELPEQQFCILKDEQGNSTFGFFDENEKEFKEFTGDATFESLLSDYSKVTHYLRFSDFINSFDQMRKDIQKLKKKNQL